MSYLHACMVVSSRTIGMREPACLVNTIGTYLPDILGRIIGVIKNMIVAMAIRGKYRCNVLTDEDTNTSDTAGLNYSK